MTRENDPFGWDNSSLTDQITSADGRALCCCEYLDTAGKRTHLLAVCCDCGVVDDFVERCVTGRHQPSGRYREMWAVVEDRACRVPCPTGGGAVRVESQVVLSVFAVCLVVLLAALHPALAVLLLLAVPLGLATLHTKSYPQCRKLFVWWLISSVTMVIYVFEVMVMAYREILLEENLFFLLLMGAAVYQGCKLRRSNNLTDLPPAKQTSSEGDVGAATTPGRDLCHDVCSHHCPWLDVCVTPAIRRDFMLMLTLFIISLTYSAHLTLCTLCTPSMLTLGWSYVLYPTQCDFVFSQYYSSVCFVSAVYSLLMSAYATLVLLRQVLWGPAPTNGRLSNRCLKTFSPPRVCLQWLAFCRSSPPNLQNV